MIIDDYPKEPEFKEIDYTRAEICPCGLPMILVVHPPDAHYECECGEVKPYKF